MNEIWEDNSCWPTSESRANREGQSLILKSKVLKSFKRKIIIQALFEDMEAVLNTNKITIRRVEKGMVNLEGKTFCFTGKLDTMKRKEAEELVAKHGGASRSSG